jgi:uncharacterized protein YjbI with pentapeptide repeats
MPEANAKPFQHFFYSSDFVWWVFSSHRTTKGFPSEDKLMANPEHLKILKQGVESWNAWRKANPDERPHLSKADLTRAILDTANLNGANLFEANLTGAELAGANLTRAELTRAELLLADLSGADLTQAKLDRVNFRGADLTRANLTGAGLFRANLTEAILTGADFAKTGLTQTMFTFTDLSVVKGLDTCTHLGPSSLDTHTLTKSRNLPEIFLRGCGLSDKQIQFLPSVFQDEALQFYSCFISHSTKDHLFAERLFNDLQGKGVRTWYAPEEMKGGEKLYDQIDSAIRLHDKLLLVLSDQSLQSEWVMTEIRRCRKAEKREGKRKLFPIRLVDMETIQEWECFDADSGKDLAVEVREFFLPDFSHWKDHDAYTKAFDRLLRDLQDSAE